MWQWEASWTTVWTVGFSRDPAQPVGSKYTKDECVLIRRLYKKPEDAEQAKKHLAPRFPRNATFRLVPSIGCG